MFTYVSQYLNYFNIHIFIHVFSLLTDFISSILAVPVNGTVGNPQDINCLIATTSVLDPSSVASSWVGPNGVVIEDERVKINITFNDNVFSTILHFDSLWESDKGVYTCNVTGDHSVSLSTTLNLLSKLYS